VGQTQQHLKPVKSNNSCGTNTTISYICEIKQLVWDKHNNILKLWNKAIGVGQTKQHIKPVKSNNSCVQKQHLKPVK
jgi:TfoX/Sxy family transcriptional regulator of competence genes